MAGLTETASRNLAGELARHRKTREDLAKAWGCAPKTVDTRLRGQTPLTTDEIEKPPTYSVSKPPPSPCSSSSRLTASNNSKPKETEMSQLLNPPKPPESRKTMKPRIELIGTTGYAIRIQEDKSGQLIELHADGEEVLADIPESTLDNFAYTLNDDLGNMR